MGFFSGILYNLKGLKLGIQTPRLLALGLARVLAVIVITALCASLIMVYHEEILALLWSRPESKWLVWLWVVVSWLLSLILVALSAVVGYLVA